MDKLPLQVYKYNHRVQPAVRRAVVVVAVAVVVAKVVVANAVAKTRNMTVTPQVSKVNKVLAASVVVWPVVSIPEEEEQPKEQPVVAR